MKKVMALTSLIAVISFDSFADVIEPDMVEIPAGKFTMGHDNWHSYVSNKPTRLVSVKKFALAKYEVTNKEFQQFLNETNYTLTMEKNSKGINCVELTFENNEPNFRRFFVDWTSVPEFEPAVCISHHDARSYVSWLAKKTDKPYRLPSEAEWEYAARAGTSTKFFYGDDKHKACSYGNVNDVNRENTHQCDDGYKGYSPVGMFRANPWGLFDIIGNADEFVADCQHKGSYQGAPTNQQAWDKNCGNEPMFIRRGGAAMENIEHLTERAHMGGTAGTVHAGFRVAMDLPSNEDCDAERGLCSVNQTTQRFRKELSAAQATEASNNALKQSSIK